jgi:hypothetical protein
MTWRLHAGHLPVVLSHGSQTLVAMLTVTCPPCSP